VFGSIDAGVPNHARPPQHARSARAAWRRHRRGCTGPTAARSAMLRGSHEALQRSQRAKRSRRSSEIRGRSRLGCAPGRSHAGMAPSGSCHFGPGRPWSPSQPTATLNSGWWCDRRRDLVRSLSFARSSCLNLHEVRQRILPLRQRGTENGLASIGVVARDQPRDFGASEQDHNISDLAEQHARRQNLRQHEERADHHQADRPP